MAPLVYYIYKETILTIDYKVYFKKLKANQIYNYVEARRNIKKRLEHNQGSRYTITFFENLEKSILEYGIRNPIIALCLRKERENKALAWFKCGDEFMGFKKKDLPEEYDKLLICVEAGGSRLYYADKYDIEVPCLICDFTGTINGEIVKSEAEALSYFQDPPRRLFFDKKRIMIEGANHIHMPRKRKKRKKD